MNYLSKKLVTGDGRTITVDAAVKICKNFLNLAKPVNGKIQQLSGNDYSIRVDFETIDCDRLETVRTAKYYSLTTNKKVGSDNLVEKVRSISNFHEVSDIAHVVSNNGKYLAKLTNTGEGQTKKQILRLWEDSRLIKCIDISELKEHGSIITDSTFGSLSWYSFDGQQDKLLYVCESKKPKSFSFFKGNQKEEESNVGSVKMEPEHLRKVDWGETLSGVGHTVIGILDISDDFKIHTIEMQGFTLGTSQWLADGRILSVAYQEEPRMLGMVYHNSRPSKIVVHERVGNDYKICFELSSRDDSYHTPRRSNDGRKFISLVNPTYGAHYHMVKICLTNLIDSSTRILADESTNKSEFLMKNLPMNCFTKEDKEILFVYTDHLFHHMCLYSFELSKTIQVEFPTTGISLMDLENNLILAAGSEVNATPTVFVATYNSIEDVIAWHQLEDFIHFDDVQYSSQRIDVDDTFISTLLIEPKMIIQGSLPTIVFLHGGPHSSMTAEYIAKFILYSRLGLQTLVINYRGSTGIDESYVSSLIGNVGTMDVNDCLRAIRFYVEAGKVDPGRLIVMGGSHGGFLAAHLCCQDEFKFTSAIITNPVIDMSSLHRTSDIPDWCYTEALGHTKYDPAWLPKEEDLVKMFQCSPISRVSRCNVPTLMLLGTQDKRVNMFQGEIWVNHLKARGIETMCKLYEDCHGLQKPTSSLDAVMSSIDWMLDHA